MHCLGCSQRPLHQFGVVLYGPWSSLSWLLACKWLLLLLLGSEQQQMCAANHAVSMLHDELPLLYLCE